MRAFRRWLWEWLWAGSFASKRYWLVTRFKVLHYIDPTDYDRLAAKAQPGVEEINERNRSKDQGTGSGSEVRGHTDNEFIARGYSGVREAVRSLPAVTYIEWVFYSIKDELNAK